MLANGSCVRLETVGLTGIYKGKKKYNNIKNAFAKNKIYPEKDVSFKYEAAASQCLVSKSVKEKTMRI